MIPLRGLYKNGFAGRAALARWQSNFVLFPHSIMTPPAAENPDGEGFEPSLPFGKHAFQACAIDHSATHPFLGDQYS